MDRYPEVFIDQVISLLAIRYNGSLCLEAYFYNRDYLTGEKSIWQFDCREKIEEGYCYSVKVKKISIDPFNGRTKDSRLKVNVLVDILSTLGKRKFGQYKKPTSKKQHKEETNGEKEKWSKTKPGGQWADFSISRQNDEGSAFARSKPEAAQFAANPH